MKELEENQRGMKKKVNPKVMNMIDKWVVIVFFFFFFFFAYGILKDCSFKGRKEGSRFEEEHCDCGKGQGEN